MFHDLKLVCPRCINSFKKKVLFDKSLMYAPVEMYYKCPECSMNLQSICRFEETPNGLILLSSTPVEYRVEMPSIAFKKKKNETE
jgi:hypothetical protein